MQLMQFLSKSFLAALIISITLTGTSCQSENAEIAQDTLSTSASSPAQSDNQNIVRNNSSAALLSKYDNAMQDAEPFSSYTFEFSVAEDKYIITAELSADHRQIVLSIEDNQFNFSTYIISAPEKYMNYIPYSQSKASQICSLIKNNIDETSVPDILQFDFYLADYSEENLPNKVSKFYSIKNNEFTEIELLDATSSIVQQMEYTEDTYLYHTEAAVFMPKPKIYTNANGRLEADVDIYSFIPQNMTMTKCNVDSSPSNPLYFGYACHAVADEIYKYFTVTSLNVSDFDNYIEVPVPNSDVSNYFLKVDDERFPNYDSLKQYVSGYFSDRIVNNMFLNAPQKYRDFNDQLYTIYGDYAVDSTLGKLTITSYTQPSEGIIMYTTAQEKYNENKELTGYIDGGDFTVEYDDINGINFKLMNYRFPNGY